MTGRTSSTSRTTRRPGQRGNTATSWTPVGVVPGGFYAFELSFLEIFLADDPRLSTGGRPYLLTSAYQSLSTKYLPEPSGAAVWATGLLALAWGPARRARRGPASQAP